MNHIQKFTHWYFSERSLPYWVVLALDCLIVLFSSYVGNYFDIGGANFASRFWQMTAANLIAVIMFIPAFRIFHTYTGILRYTSLIDLKRVGGAVILGGFLAFLAGRLIQLADTADYFEFHHFKGIVTTIVGAVMLMWIVRILVRTLFDSIREGSATPVAIYGTRAGGISLAHSITGAHDREYSLQAFVSDAEDMRNAYLLGIPVIINGEDIGRKLNELGVKVLLISPLKTEKFRNTSWMIDQIIDNHIRVLMMPPAAEWDGKTEIRHDQLHEVQIEDLLPRDQITVDMDAIGKMLRNKRILITGAAGSIGSEMVRQICNFNPSELILVDQAETPMHSIRLMMANQYAYIKAETIVVSITDQVQMEDIFRQHRPEYVFHAAAYKHVPMMEDNPAQAVRNNIRGTRIIADLAVKYGTRKFVMVSTDKAVNPTNVMGCSKRICEIYCQSLNQAIASGTLKPSDSIGTLEHKPVTQFVTTRFGNVLGSNGSVIPIFKKQIKNGGPVTVTHPDIIRYFMLIPEACRLVLEAGTMGKGGEIFVFDMGKPVRIADLAKRMINLSGAINVEIKFTGLRDGEKLYEEVLNDAEGTIPTNHPKIKVAKVREYDYDTACRNEDELLQISYTQDDMQIVKKMKEIVPEYKSKVSKYEVLDK